MADSMVDRITVDPKILVGKPVIRGTRLTVDFVLGLMAQGASIEEITEEYSGVCEEDIRACLFFAARSVASVTD